MKKSLIVLLGPTGVGKTDLSISLAKSLDSPIISADSRQIYDTMRIGTAAPTDRQLAEVKHYFVGKLALSDYYSAAQYEQEVLALLQRLFADHDYIVMTGGSMMYLDAVTKGIDDIPTVDDETRRTLAGRLEEEGLERLTAELKILDPEYYETVDKKNPKRVVHALEICYMTGRTYTSFRQSKKKERPFEIVKFGLMRSRNSLFERINKRVDQMMSDGLLDEAKGLYDKRSLNSLNTVGYKELFAYMDGKWDLPTATERIKKNTRVYAKKQMTWFKHDESIIWLDADNNDSAAILSQINDIIHNDKQIVG